MESCLIHFYPETDIKRRERDRGCGEERKLNLLVPKKPGNLRGENRRQWPVPPAYIDCKCTEECVLTLHGFAKPLPQLPAMFLKQPVPNVILAERTEEKKTKNIPIIRGAFPRGHG